MKKKISIILVLVMISVSMLSLTGCSDFKRIATPQGFSTGSNYVQTISQGDYYVSTQGNDNNQGTKNSPYATIVRARDEVRKRIANNTLPQGKLTVAIMAGEYYERGLAFEQIDSGTSSCKIVYTAYGDGEVVINGGINLNPNDFERISGEQKSRLNKKTADKIVSLDLAKYNLTQEDYGKLYAIGAYNTADKYTGDTTGSNACELFVGGDRMTLARYPNDKSLSLGKVVDNGYAYEAPIGTYHEDWKSATNPRGGTFRIDLTTNNRVKKWKTLDDVWMFGYFYWDWADMSTPIKNFNPSKKEITTEYCSKFGFKKGADYYFYNVFEELDAPGEYYLDRNSGILYIYAEEGLSNQDIQLSLTTAPIIKADVDNVQFNNLTLKNGRDDGIKLTGSNNEITNCKITDITGNGISVDGYNNMIQSNEIFKMGRCGIVLKGGDKETLTSGNNIADNNHIYSIGEIYKTYNPGIDIFGVGNIASHNEIHDLPHIAIRYEGYEHIMEYNNIYDAVLTSTDAGAIYAGRNFYYGCVVRYNAIYNIGSKGFNPDAIYFDDVLAGQSAYGNIIVNIPKTGILVGGGRDNDIYNNLIINAKTPISYDDRAYDGFNNKGWYNSKVAKPDSSYWKLLEEAKRLNNQWSNKYSGINVMHADFGNTSDANFAVNPSGAVVKNNITLSPKGKIGDIAKSVTKYGVVRDNYSYKLKDIGFANYKKGSYILNNDYLANISFTAIPISSIGRY